MTMFRAGRNTLSAKSTFCRIEENFFPERLGFRIMTPQAMQRTSFHKYDRSDSRSIVNCKFFNIENKCFCIAHTIPHVFLYLFISDFHSCDHIILKSFRRGSIMFAEKPENHTRRSSARFQRDIILYFCEIRENFSAADFLHQLAILSFIKCCPFTFSLMISVFPSNIYCKRVFWNIKKNFFHIIFRYFLIRFSAVCGGTSCMIPEKSSIYFKRMSLFTGKTFFRQISV